MRGEARRTYRDWLAPVGPGRYEDLNSRGFAGGHREKRPVIQSEA